VAGGSPQELKRIYIRNPILEVECDRVVDALELLQREDWVLETSIFGTYLHVSVTDEGEGRERIGRLLGANGIIVKRMDRIVPSLEDVFIHRIEEESKN
jgi:ABC-2 type transport system ATP-binding protein